MRRMLILEILLVLLLIGCVSMPSQEQENWVEAGTALHQNAASVSLPTEDEGEVAEIPMSEEEVLLAYDRAEEAWGWFSQTPLPSGEERVQVGDAVYWKVNSPRFETMEDLRSYLHHLFSPELTDRLLDMEAPTPVYLDFQGALYVREDAGQGRDHSKGAQQIQVEQESDTSYSVNITVDLLDKDHLTVVGLEFWSFLYELVENQWVFTSFEQID